MATKAVALTNPSGMVPTKPMTPAQSKNLEKLVNSDFADLFQSVGAHINKMRDARLREINDATANQKIVEKATVIQDTTEASIRALLNKAREKLVTLGVEPPSNFAHFNINRTIALSGQDAEAKKVTLAAGRVNRVATEAITRMQRAVNRDILLLGITGEVAEDILTKMPSLDGVFETIKTELDGYEDDMKVLQG